MAAQTQGALQQGNPHWESWIPDQGLIFTHNLGC